jgi:hypothetical protein
MMSYPYLKAITVSGFKSIRDATVELGDINVLIGANGAGKSNLLQLFLFLRRLAEVTCFYWKRSLSWSEKAVLLCPRGSTRRGWASGWTILFVDIERLLEVVTVSADCQRKLKGIAQAVSTPEDINHSVSGHPSQRIKSCIPGFSKLLHGMACVRSIGLARIRLKCPHFNEWVSKLEQLS